MRTPLLPILFLFGLGILGLYMVYAAVILPLNVPMGGEPTFTTIQAIVVGAAGVVLLFVAGKTIWARLDEQPAVPPDVVVDDEPVFLCTTCLAEVDPLLHYCRKCGDATGRYTGYVPYVNIQFEFNFLGRVWHRVWREPGIPPWKRVGLFVVMITIAPIMLIGLPFVFLERARLRRKSA